jgi:hypothetical protein
VIHPIGNPDFAQSLVMRASRPSLLHQLLVAGASPGNRLDNDLAVRQESYAALSHRDLKCPTIA